MVPLLLLGGAYVAELGFGLYPCEMCWWQRYAHFAALPFAAVALAGPARLRVPATVLAGAAVLASGAIGGFHAGVEYGWWQGLSACTSPIGSGADLLDQIMNAPLQRCDTAPWSLFGISLAGYNFLLSGAGALLIFGAAMKERQR